MSTKRDYYEILGLKKDAKVEDIRKAYREMALKYHPDRVPPEQKKQAEENFKEISEAYAVLSDQNKRALYDQYGHSGIDQKYAYEDIFKGADFNSVFRGMGGGEAGGFGSFFEDIFDDLGFDIMSGRRSHGQARRKGRDLQITVSVTLTEAAAGLEKSLSIPRYELCESCNGSGAKPGTKPVSCSQCRGRGRVMVSSGFFQLSQTCPQCRGDGTVIKEPCESCRGEGRVKKTTKIKVKIPPGVDNGSTLRVRGEGESGTSGRGDLYVNIEVVPHDIFQRKDDDLFVETNISLSKAVLGGEISVPTLDGTVSMKIPAGTQSGKIFRLKAKGMPSLHSGVPGDELVKISVQIPTRLNARQRELMEEYARASGEAVNRESLADKIKNKFT